jgi:hypothetical protein
MAIYPGFTDDGPDLPVGAPAAPMAPPPAPAVADPVGDRQLADIAGAGQTPPPPAFKLSPTDQKDLAALQQFRDGLTAKGTPAVDPNRVPGAIKKDAHVVDRAEFARRAAAPPPASADPLAQYRPAPAPQAPSVLAPGSDPNAIGFSAPEQGPAMIPRLDSQSTNANATYHVGKNGEKVWDAHAPTALAHAGAPTQIDPGAVVLAKPAAPVNNDASFAMPGAGGMAPHVVPAHTIRTVDPELGNGVLGAMKREETDTLAKGDVAAQGAADLGASKGKLVDAANARATGMIGDTAKQQAELSPLEQNQIQLAQERAAMRMTNPDKRGTGQKIGDAIAAGLSAAGMGLLHQSGPNPVMQRIHDDIDREVDRQKEEFARQGAKLNDAGNIYAQVYKRTGDANAAADAARQVQYGAVKDAVDQKATEIGGPQAKIDAKVMNDRLTRDRYQAALGQTQRVQAQTVGGMSKADEATSMALQKEFNLTPAQAYRRMITTRGGADPMPNAGPLAPLVKPGAAGGGAVRPERADFYKDLLPDNPNGIVSGWTGANSAKIKAAQTDIAHMPEGPRRDEAMSAAKELEAEIAKGGSFDAARTARMNSQVGYLADLMRGASAGKGAAPAEPAPEGNP